ncbi:18488_t:CDS:2, partial [Funneliformis geosporum]
MSKSTKPLEKNIPPQKGKKRELDVEEIEPVLDSRESSKLDELD